MSADITIDLAKTKDLDFILPLILDQFSEHSIQVDTEKLKNSIQKVLAGDQLGFVLTARTDQGLAGFAYVAFNWTLEHGGRSAWLEELYVKPELRNQGIGRKLLAAVLARAAALGCEAIDLEVDRNHSQAENLYRREGFTRLTRARWVYNFNKV